jgi:hypothetical protein
MHVGSRAMAQAVSRRPLTAETRVCARVSPCGICGGQSGIGAGVSPSSSVFRGNIIPPSLSILIYNLGNEQNARSWSQFRDTVSPRRLEHVCRVQEIWEMHTEF